jgi:hypothetical protein
LFNGTADLSVGEWIDAMKLFTLWQMDTLRGIAKKQVEALFKSDRNDETATQQFLAADSLNLPQWRRPAILRLIKRIQPITVAEALTLTPQLMAQICELRELHTKINLIDVTSEATSLIEEIECEDDDCDSDKMIYECDRCKALEMLTNLNHSRGHPPATTVERELVKIPGCAHAPRRRK